jgi:glycerol kinase
MSADRLVLAVDQGTSATKALLFNSLGQIVGRGETPVSLQFPGENRVEQDPYEIESSVLSAMKIAIGTHARDTIVAVGISNQRESIVAWDRDSGKAISNVISWQDSASHAICEEIRTQGFADEVQKISGLPLDSMFSAPKISQLLRGLTSKNLYVGTIDSWLTRSPGKATIEVGNASRTQLVDLKTGDWSPRLLEIFNIPREVLPDIKPSNHHTVLDGLPVFSIMGDSHSAFFGQGINSVGIAKATYGTGSSVMALIPESGVTNPGLCTTIAWAVGDSISYALEGNIRSAGATLVWLSQLLGLEISELASLAENAETGGVVLIPAFNGLGAPWWDANATGIIAGLSRASDKSTLAKAAIDSIAFQVNDVVNAMSEVGPKIGELMVDGGASANNYLMQLQSNLLQISVNRKNSSDFSSIGVAQMAGEEAGLWDSKILGGPTDRIFTPQKISDEIEASIRNWQKGLSLARNHNAHEGALK